MPGPSAFDYAVVRVVPRVEREEFLNVGVILCCRAARYLAARLRLDRERLAALDPACDAEQVEEHLAMIRRVCEDGGELGGMSQGERFHWLTTPRSATIQVSSVHSGLCDDPRRELEKLFVQLVA